MLADASIRTQIKRILMQKKKLMMVKRRSEMIKFLKKNRRMTMRRMEIYWMARWRMKKLPRMKELWLRKRRTKLKTTTNLILMKGLRRR